jgi:nickel superoxide dismutase
MFKIKNVYAHCDIPCGLYETDTMAHAAQTCLVMCERYEQLGEIDSADKNNQAIRIVSNKEHHANICKSQLYYLWSDYFKPEHLEKFPELHQAFWDATKQCGKVKQTVNKEECTKLVELVAEISRIFADSKS